MKRFVTKLSAVALSICMLVPTLSNSAAISYGNAADDTKSSDLLFNNEDQFFVYVGTYKNSVPQFRYLYPKSDGSYNADKVIWENAPAGLAYGDIFVAEGDVPMTQVYPAKDDPANAHVYYYTLDEGAELIKAGNCPDLMEKKDMSVTSKTYDGSSHWSIRYMDAAGKEYYYGLSTFASSLGLDPLDCEVGDVYTYALYNDHMVVPLAKQTGTITDTMTVEVVEVHDKYLLVKPTNRPNSNERLTLSMEYIDTGVNPSVGMKYEVTYTDGILETYPEQFGNVKKVSLVSDDSIASGDVNNDGAFNISDVVLLQKWLLAVPDTNLANWKAVDFCADNKLDVFDLCLMKRALLYGGTVQSDTDLKTKFPEYYDQETFKGLEVYLWQETDGGYKCGLLMGTNRNKTDEEIIALTNNGATIEEMKVILSSYSINDDMIAIIPIRISEASYEIMDSDFESVRKMFWGDDSVEPVSIAGKIFAYEKEGAGGYCTLSFNENGRFLYSPGKLSSYMDGGDWKIDGDTVSLIGMENKTIYLKITDDTLVYIAEGSDEFPYMDIKDGEKFVIYRPEISADKFQLNSRYSEYGLGDPKVELDLIVSELPEFCYVEDVRLYDEDDNFIGMMSPAMDADIWNYLVDCHVTEECSKTYYTLSKIRCGGKTYLDDVRSEITVNFKATPAP
ncbi:MAG: hypothetical protein E7495_07725 [Ruminococcus flavefaciens]|nr:hypothetical protein [Ruminococcus flavefaciens]